MSEPDLCPCPECNGTLEPPLDQEDDRYCAFHHRLEDGDYYRCGECWHRWGSATELLDDDEKARGHRLDSDVDIFCCPMCTHDF